MVLQLICTCSNEYSIANSGQQRHSMDGTVMDSGQVGGSGGVQSCWSDLASRNCHQTIDKPSKVTLIAQLAFNNGKSACWRSGDRLLQRGQSSTPTTEVPPLDHFCRPYFTSFLTLCTHELWCHYAVPPLNIMGLPLRYDILISA